MLIQNLSTLSLTLLAFSGLATGLAAGPRLEIGEAEWDFGKVYQGATATHTLTLKNAGDQDFKILLIRVSCTECLSHSDIEDVITPGKHQELTLYYYAKFNPGEHSAFVFIQSNDPDQPIVQIPIRATILSSEHAPRIDLNPTSFDVGVLQPEETLRLKINLANPQEALEALSIKEVHASSGCRVLEPWILALAAGNSGAITIELKAGPSGIINERLDIRSNDPIHPVVSIPIIGYVSKERLVSSGTDAPGLMIQAQASDIAVPGTGGKLIHSVTIENRTDETIEVELAGLENETGSADHSKVSLGQGERANVPVKIDPGRVGEASRVKVLLWFPTVLEAARDKARAKK